MEHFFHSDSLSSFDLTNFPNCTSKSFTCSNTSCPLNGIGAGLSSFCPLKSFFLCLYLWLEGRNRRCPMYTFFWHFGSRTVQVSLPQVGQALFSFTLCPDKFPYAGKSLMVQNIMARRVNLSWLYASNTARENHMCTKQKFLFRQHLVTLCVLVH